MEKRSPHVILKKDPNLDMIGAKVLSVSENDIRQRTPRQVCLLKCCLFSRGSDLTTPNVCPSVCGQIVKSSLNQ